jgi:hypothetical protein
MNDMSHVEVSPVFVGLTGNLTVGHVENQQSVRWSHRDFGLEIPMAFQRMRNGGLLHHLHRILQYVS